MAMAEPSKPLLPQIVARSGTAPAGHTRFNTVPRRYEETKPVVIQGHAHRMIVGIGNELQRRSVEMAELEKLKAIRVAEQAVWGEAEQLKAEAVQRAKEESKLDQEKMLKKVSKAQEKALKEEALRVEMAMQKLAIEQVKQERLEAEQRLKDAVKETEGQFTKRLNDAVAAARKEEKAAAAKKLADLEKNHKEKLTAALNKAENEKKKALTNLIEAKNKEMTEAVRRTKESEILLADDSLKATERSYKLQIQNLNDVLKQKVAKIDAHLKTIQALEIAKSNVEVKLMEVYAGYQDFINRVKPFESGLSDYLLPDVRLDEVGKVQQM